MSDIVYIASEALSAFAPHPNMAALWLSHRGWEVTLICPSTNPDDAVTPLGRIPLDPVKPGRLRRQWQLFRKTLAHRMRGGRLFYVQGASATIASSFALLGVPRSRRIYHTQDFLEPGRYPMRAFFERFFSRRARSVILNEYCRARFLSSWYRLKEFPMVVRTALPRDWPCPVINPALRDSLLSQFPDKPSSAETRLIAAGGGFSRIRASGELMESLTHLPQRYRLVFTAMNPQSPSYADAMSFAEKLHVRDRICMLPRMSYADLLGFFAICDIGVLLYPNEGVGAYFQQPGRLTEYMLAGLPTVASNFVGLELTVLKYGLGAVGDPMSPASIAQAIMAVGEQSTEARLSQRERLREMARTTFAYESQADQIEAVVESVLGKRHGAPLRERSSPQ